jgi:hypothetical protein
MKSACGRQTPPPDYELTCVESGSPMGELLRRYWQPVCTADDLRDLTKKVNLLCEGACGPPRQEGSPRSTRAALLTLRHVRRRGSRRGRRAALLLSQVALRHARPGESCCDVSGN